MEHGAAFDRGEFDFFWFGHGESEAMIGGRSE